MSYPRCQCVYAQTQTYGLLICAGENAAAFPKCFVAAALLLGDCIELMLMMVNVKGNLGHLLLLSAGECCGFWQAAFSCKRSSK